MFEQNFLQHQCFIVLSPHAQYVTLEARPYGEALFVRVH